jgi:hypothetical protein
MSVADAGLKCAGYIDTFKAAVVGRNMHMACVRLETVKNGWKKFWAGGFGTQLTVMSLPLNMTSDDEKGSTIRMIGVTSTTDTLISPMVTTPKPEMTGCTSLRLHLKSLAGLNGPNDACIGGYDHPVPFKEAKAVATGSIFPESFPSVIETLMGSGDSASRLPLISRTLMPLTLTTLSVNTREGGFRKSMV